MALADNSIKAGNSSLEIAVDGPSFMNGFPNKSSSSKFNSPNPGGSTFNWFWDADRNRKCTNREILCGKHINSLPSSFNLVSPVSSQKSGRKNLSLFALRSSRKRVLRTLLWQKSFDKSVMLLLASLSSLSDLIWPISAGNSAKLLLLRSKILNEFNCNIRVSIRLSLQPVTCRYSNELGNPSVNG